MSKPGTNNAMAIGFSNVIILLCSIALQGAVLSKVWLWFIVPLGVSPINIIHAIGIPLVVALIVEPNKKENPNKGWGTVTHNICKHVVDPLYLLGVGWVLYLFM